jgi:protein TonB
MRVYAVDIVSPPPQALGEFNPQPPVAAPEPEPPPPEPEEPEPEPEPEPAPAPREEPRATPPRETPPAPPAEEPAPRPSQPSTGARPDPSSAGGAGIDMQLRGVQCPSPDYCNNIILQINRYFRSPGTGGAGQADVYFVINRDGSVSNLRLISSTGGSGFRLAVMEAVEQAGRNRAFGPLPGPFGADQLPVSFYFRPAR